MNDFTNVLTKLGYKKTGGGATGGRENWSHQNGTVVSLSLHPMDGRVLNFNVERDAQDIGNGKDATELLRILQDKSGAGAFRKVQYAEPSNRTGGHPLRKQLAMGEGLDHYGNNIERAISEIFHLDEQAVTELVSKLEFEDYLNLAIALDQDNIQEAEGILQRFGIKYGGEQNVPARPTPESVAAHINYLTKNNEDNIITPEFKRLKIGEQRKVLDSLLTSQLQKMMANLRGYAEPGMFESGLFGPVLREEILSQSSINVVFHEAIPNAPNKPNGANSDERLERDSEVAVADPNGETEDGTVVADTGNNVMVQTKTGRKSVKKGDLMQPVVDENAIDMRRVKELAGIQTPPIQEIEEEEEEEITEDDDSLGTNYTLEVDGSDVKKNSDPEELMSYAEEHAQGMEWTVYDSDNEDVAATWDGTGFLQDAAVSSSMRQSKKQGWEAKDEVRRGEKLPYEIGIDDYDREEPMDPRDIISDEHAARIAQKVLWAIGENWPDGDPGDAAHNTIRRAMGHVDSIQFDAAQERVAQKFEDENGVDYYGYFNQLTDQMQADNPPKHGRERFKKGGGGKARGEYDDVPRV